MFRASKFSSSGKLVRSFMAVLSCIPISSLADSRRGPLAWGLGGVLTVPHRKKLPCDETLTIHRTAHELNNSSDRKLYLFYQRKYQILMIF